MIKDPSVIVEELLFDDDSEDFNEDFNEELE